MACLGSASILANQMVAAHDDHVSRRAAGEGSVHPHGGKWRARLRHHGREKSWVCATKAEAASKLREALRATDPSIMVRQRGGNVTVSAWAEEWLGDLSLTRPRTRGTYANKLAHVLPVIGSVSLNQVTASDIKAVLAAGKATGLGGTSLQHIHGTLRALFAAAIREHRIFHNPVTDIARPARDHFEAQPLRTEQARALMDASGKSQSAVGAMTILGLMTGMRIGEILALQWSDLRQGDGVITITRSVRSRRGEGTVVSPPKTRAGRRSIPLDPRLAAVLRKQQVRVDAMRLRAGEGWHDLDLVFPSRRGQHLSGGRAFFDQWRNLLSVAGCPPIRFHDLRHTAGLMLTRDAGLVVASRILGHSTPATTAKYYGHVQPDDISRAVDDLSDRLWGEVR